MKKANRVFVVVDYSRSEPAVAAFDNHEAAQLYLYYLATADKALVECPVLNEFRITPSGRRAGCPI